MTAKDAIMFALEDAPNSEVKELLDAETMEYAKIAKSERFAKKIMEDYNVTYTPLNEVYKRYFCLLIAYAKKRGISFDKELLGISISNEDICNRLKEQEENQMKKLEFDILRERQKDFNLISVINEEYRDSLKSTFEEMYQKASEIFLPAPRK